MSSPPLVVAVLILFALVVAGLVIDRRDRSRRNRDPLPPRLKRRIGGVPRLEIPLSERKRTMKLCPDCHELAPLAATACRYCGCALPSDVKPEAAVDPAL